MFEAGSFAGIEEMRTNERLLRRVAPMGVNDIAMACRYQFLTACDLDIPVTTFDGLADQTIERGAQPMTLYFHVLFEVDVLPGNY